MLASSQAKADAGTRLARSLRALLASVTLSQTSRKFNGDEDLDKDACGIGSINLGWARKGGTTIF